MNSYQLKICLWLVIIIPFVIIGCLTLTGCNTVAGLGSDIQKSAEWSRDKISSTPINK